MKKIAVIGILPIIGLSILAISYSCWYENLYIEGTVNTGNWKADIYIEKTLEGSFTDPTTGEDLTDPTNLIAIASETFPTKFKLTIRVENRESVTLTNVEVTDKIELQVTPVEWTPIENVYWIRDPPGGEPGEFAFYDLTWNIGSLPPYESAELEIWLETARNPTGKYEPTSGGQDLEINKGATVTAETPHTTLSATTGSITIMVEETPDDEIGRITPTLPITVWAADTYP